MAHYKIKNITGSLPKRHVNKDTVLNIEYHVGFQKKYRKLGVHDEILLTCKTLPVSLHQLRVKKLITISEISENEFTRLQKPSAKKVPKVNEPIKKEESTSTEVEPVVDLSEEDENDSDEENSSEDETSTGKKTTKRKGSGKSSSTAIIKD